MRLLAAAALLFAIAGPLKASAAPLGADGLPSADSVSDAPSAPAPEPSSAPADADREARVTDAQGTVYLHLHGQPDDDFITAEKGAPLEPGDLVRTGTDGQAEVTLDGESVIDLSPNTDFVVNSLARRQTEFQVGIGAIAAKIKTLLFGESMNFRTATAVAAVRGTELAVAQDGDDQPARVGVFDEGHVSVTTPQGSAEVSLGPGQETEVSHGGQMALPRALSSFAGERDRMAAIRRRVAFQRQHWQPRSRQQRAARRMAMRQRPVLHGAQLRNVRADIQARHYAQKQRGQKQRRRQQQRRRQMQRQRPQRRQTQRRQQVQRRRQIAQRRAQPQKRRPQQKRRPIRKP